MHNPALLTPLSERFTPTEVQQIVAFVERGFSPNGELVVISIFGYAKDHGKPVADVLAACEEEWEREWKYKHPDIRGDPDAPATLGVQARISLNNVYHAIGVPDPFVEGSKVPKEPLVVKTSNSTYKIGKADEKDERDIARVEKPLPFARCKLTFLAKDKPMEFVRLDASGATIGHWSTSCVESITVG